jgi:hypothetical protein
VAVTLGAITLTLAFGVSSASAVVAKIGGHSYGITPIEGVNPASIAGAQRTQTPSVSPPSSAPRIFDGAPEGGGPLVEHGGPVMHSNNTHVIYWDPNGEFTATTTGIIDGFFTNVAHDSGLASNVFGIAGQYTDGSGNAAYNSTFGGTLVDGEAYPTSGCAAPEGVRADPGPYTECLYDSQLRTGLEKYINEHSLPKGPTQLYFLLLPHKVATCFEEEEEGEEVCSNNSFCAYHSVMNEGTPSEIIYADIPFSLLDTGDVKGCQDDGNEGLLQHPNGDIAGTNASTRFVDVALKYISHEFIEAVTDPHLNSWFDANGLEIGDKCNGVHGNGSGIGYDPSSFLPVLGGKASEGTLFNQSINTGSYYLQSEWDNTGKACLMKPLAITGAGFTPTSESTIVGSTVNFNASATDPYGKMGFAWDFGDGETGTGPSPSHAYRAPGEYTVTMTPTDELTGSTATPVQHTVIVKSTQAISFTSTAPGSATVGGSTYTVAATASSGLPVSFSSGTPSVCAVTGSVVSFMAAGTCTIDADQAGNAEFVAAPQMQQSFAVAIAPTPTPRVASELQVASAPPTPTGTVALLGANISIGANGAGTVKLSCTGTAACGGRLTLTVKIKGKNKRVRTVTLGGASFSIALGATGTITLKLNAAGRSQLRAAHGHLRAILKIVKSSPAPAVTQARGVQVRRKTKK